MFKLFAKGIKSVAAGNSQASLGLQSPHLSGAIDRIGRFLFGVTGAWIGVTWYTAYANTKTDPGSGPTLVLPGITGKGTNNSPSRPDSSPGGTGPLGGTIPSATGTGSSGGGNSGGSPGATGGPVRLAIARMARAWNGRPGLTYLEVRPMPNNMNSRPWRGDCSTFATLIYKANGAADPNGFGYNGQGNTTSLQQKGTVVKTPQLGDLAFWSNPDHVAIVTGTGANPQVTGFGAPPTPITNTVTAESAYHSSFVGYRSYL